MRIRSAVKPPRRRWLLIIGVSGAAVAGALGWVAWWSPLLAVNRIEVSGAQRVDRAQVLDASGVRQGTPLARVDTGSVRERVSGLRAVESARVHRVWPSTLRVAVRERAPVAAVPADGAYALLDRDGVHVATVREPTEDLPVVRITGSGAASRGASGTPGRAARRAALRVLDALPERVAAQADRIGVGAERRITLRLGDATVTWGKPDHVTQKARILTTLLRRHDADSYDVSSLETVTVD